MNHFLRIIFGLIFLLLSVTNQRQFSLLADNLVPVRILLICFLLFAVCYFVWQERRNAFKTAWSLVRNDKVLVLMLALFLWRALSLTQTSDFTFGLVMLGWWGSVVAFYFLGSYFVKTVGLEKLGLYGLLGGVCLSVVVAIYQTVSFVGWGIQRFDLWGWQYPDGFRVPGLMLDSNHFGIFMVVGFFVAAWFWLAKKRYVEAALASFLTLGAYSLASSRSALLGLLAGSAFLVVVLLVKKEFKILVVFVAVLVIGLSSGTAISKAIEIYTNNYVTTSVILHQEVSDERVTSESIELPGVFSVVSDLLPSRVRRVFDASAQSHLEMLKASWELGLRFPILGVGYGNFAAGLRGQPDLFATASRFDVRGFSTTRFPSHTLWGEQLAETGFVGLVLFFLLTMAILVRILKAKSLSGVFFAATWVSLLIFGVFYAANEEFFWLIMFLGIWL